MSCRKLLCFSKRKSSKDNLNVLIPQYYLNNKKAIKTINSNYPKLLIILKDNHILNLKKINLGRLSPRSRESVSYCINFKNMQFYIPNSRHYNSSFTVHKIGKDKLVINGYFDTSYWKCKIKFNNYTAIVKIYNIEHKNEYILEI
jgi:hypothetical protein